MKGWPTRALADVCQIRPPKGEARRGISDADLVSFVPMEDLGIGQKNLVPTQVKPLSEVVDSYTYFADGDVLLAKITPCFENGKLGIAAYLSNGIGFGSSEYVVFRPGQSIDKNWLYYFLSRESFRKEGAERMSGAVGHKRVAGKKWVVKKLGEVCDLFQGLAINKGTKHLLVEDSSLPLLRIKDLRDGTEEQYVAEVGFPKSAEISPNDIIYTRTGQIGLVFRGRRGVLHNNSFKVVPRSELDRGYLFWWLQEPSFRQSIIGLASRAAQPDITHKLFKMKEIQLPPMNYQHDAVNKIEELYGNTQRLQILYQQKLERLAELKQAILQKAFAGELNAQPEKALQEAAAA